MAGQKQIRQPTAQSHDGAINTPLTPVYTPLQWHFIERLLQLDRLRQEYEQSTTPDTLVLQFIKKAIYATLRDCEDEGIREEAQAALDGTNTESPTR